jgi:murein DD-endopeptidase MepM/ murein hydrolase activator NlpD
MSRLAILILGMVLGAAAVVLTFSLWLDPGMTQAGSRVHPTMSPGELAVAPVVPGPARPARPAGYPATQAPVSAPFEAEPIAEPAIEPVQGAGQAAIPITPPMPIPAPSTTPESGLLIPVSGILAKQLSDTFTQSRGAGRLHDAIDIMAPRGTPVVAVADGRVAKLFNSKPGGLTLYQFDAEEKLAYYYAHLDSYAPTLVEGQQLRRGDVIGYVGSTGNASPDGPHLHFAVFILAPDKKWWQGTPINPYPLLGGG